MADQRHLEILRQGAEVWNHWRLENNKAWPCRENFYSEVAPIDLAGADLREANLRGAALDVADLRGADLTGAELNHAKIRWANLDKAVVAHANLYGATLNQSTLKAANLASTSLQRAELLGVDLTGANLADALFMWADLRGAITNRAILTRANFQEAKLAGASMLGVDAAEARFTGALLRGTDFGEANLTGCDFTEAQLFGTNLRGANLAKSRVGGTVFGDSDLSGCRGLSSVLHSAASVVDVATMYRSGGEIPDGFLRSAGVPEQFLGYMKTVSKADLRFYSCLISYSSKDQTFADRLYHDLQLRGVRCWFAPEDLKIGDRIRVEIDNAIRIYDKLLLVLSEHSLASQWVEHEVESALNKERDSGGTVLFPIRLDSTPMHVDRGWPALVRRTRHIGDFCEWMRGEKYQQALDRLIEDLRAEGMGTGT